MNNPVQPDRGEPNASPAVSFVVPCYNERNNIAQTIESIETGLKNAAVLTYEIIVVDDRSTDGTGDFVAQMVRGNSRFVLESNATNLGFGGAYKAGLKRARGDYVIMVPGDNAFLPPAIETILRKAGQADIVIPYFNNPNARNTGRRILSRTFTLLLNVMFNLKVPYYNGPVLHRSRLLQAIEIKTDGFAFQAEGLIKLLKAGATFTPVGVQVFDRTEGRSTALKLKNVYRVIATLMRLWIEVRRSNEQTQAKIERNRVRPPHTT
jgi:glycosyltransferase involved in cell wall biosynthesis